MLPGVSDTPPVGAWHLDEKVEPSFLPDPEFYGPIRVSISTPARAVAALPAIEGYCSLMYKVLKQVRPDTEISAEASCVVNRYLQDILLAVTSQSETFAARALRQREVAAAHDLAHHRTLLVALVAARDVLHVL